MKHLFLICLLISSCSNLRKGTSSKKEYETKSETLTTDFLSKENEYKEKLSYADNKILSLSKGVRSDAIDDFIEL